MGQRIGLIQAAGIGDIIIALPIADYFIEQGCEVLWPIDAAYLNAFAAAKPEIQFIGIERGESFAYDLPRHLLEQASCDRIITLLSYLLGKKVYNESLARSLKFDEYKYAVAGVPFDRKWRLKLRRDAQRERALFDRLEIRGPYVCVHDSGSNFRANVSYTPDWIGDLQVVRIQPLTDNPFDWLLTLERAARLVLIDSCFSNLVEQLNMPNEKHLILRSPAAFTPVMKNGWHFIAQPVSGQ